MVEQIVCCLIYEGVTDWVAALLLTELTINNGVNDRNGYLPAHIIYGLYMRMLFDMLGGIYIHVSV